MVEVIIQVYLKVHLYVQLAVAIRKTEDDRTEFFFPSSSYLKSTKRTFFFFFANLKEFVSHFYIFNVEMWIHFDENAALMQSCYQSCQFLLFFSSSDQGTKSYSRFGSLCILRICLDHEIGTPWLTFTTIHAVELVLSYSGWLQHDCIHWCKLNVVVCHTQRWFRQGKHIVHALPPPLSLLLFSYQKHRK